ncbi:MAG: hypothetical protein AAFP03_08945, partial [Cyanobacteria bacterium J06598_3]
MQPVTLSDMTIDLPLYEQFLEIGQEIGKASNRDFCGEWDSLDIIFSPLEELSDDRYFCTPLNSLSFARTGVDGEHFSFLVFDNVINAKSPVVVTAPMGREGSQNAIVAKNFKTFLRLWVRFGGFPLVDLAFDREHALTVYTDAEWQPKGSTAGSDYNQGDEHRAVL